MKLFNKLMVFFVLVGLPVIGQTQEPKKQSNSNTASSVDKMQQMLDYHQKMVSKIQAYMKDRAQIPAEYRAVSDNEFLRRLRSEKIAAPKNQSAPMSQPSKPSTKEERY